MRLGNEDFVLNLKALKERLDKVGVPERYYSLAGGLPSEALCIVSEGESWTCYYSEHGLRTSEWNFATEDEACDFMFDTLTSEWIRNIKQGRFFD